MALSHVWSHGQGGRPEDGINLCLQERYCRLAGHFNCDSYKDIVHFWKGHKTVNTAFLISSVPRIEDHPSLGWAPVTPYIRPQRRSAQLPNGEFQEYRIRYPSYYGRGSWIAQVESRGLIGVWLALDISEAYAAELWDECVSQMTPSQWIEDDIEQVIARSDIVDESKVYE